MGTTLSDREDVNSKGSFENIIFNKIEKIMNGEVTSGELIIQRKTKSFKTIINDVVKKNKSNSKDSKKLAIYLISEVDSEIFRSDADFGKDKKLSILAIQKNPYLFYAIDGELQKDVNIGKEALKSMIRKSWSFDLVEEFIGKYFKKETNKMLKFYYKNLELADTFLKNDLSKNITALKDSNKNLYTTLSLLGLFNTKGKNISINSMFIIGFMKVWQNNEVFISLDSKAKKLYIKDFLENIFSNKYDKLSKEEKSVFDLVIDLFDIQLIKNNKKTQEKKEKLEKSKQEDIGEDKIDIKNTKNQDNDSYDEDFSDLVDFSYPECTYYSVSSGYNIETVTGKTVFISKSEKENFTSKALANYISFYNLLYDLGLNFLWEKYLHDFKILCKNKIGFDYMYGEGITGSKTLAILNMIGKNIGIPEKEILDEKGESTNIYKCFELLADAKSAFSNINETGVINEHTYIQGFMSGRGAVENKLIEIGCIDINGKGLQTSEWK